MDSTLRGITEALQLAFFADDLSRRTGLLQSLEARSKVILCLELLLCVSLARTPWTIVGIYVSALGLGAYSSVSIWTLLRRVWLALPFFTLPIALPAIVLTPGIPLLELPLGLAITRPGLLTAIFLLLRVACSLTLVLLLIYTTSWNGVLAAVTGLGVPSTVALMLGMTQRYVHLLLRLAADMFLSRQSRLVGDLSARDSRRMLAASAGALLDRSLSLSQEVYLAMQSRGYSASNARIQRMGSGRRDWLAILSVTLTVIAAIWLDHRLASR